MKLRPARAGRPKFDLGDIAREHRAAFVRAHAPSTQQKRVLVAISRCRTAALGGHLDRCPDCGFERPAYNSCRDRHCPKCQALAQEAWIGAERERLLELPHFHVVFTLPAELRALARFAPRVVYGLLFTIARDVLATFGRSRLKATIGATLVLHTWRRDLQFHPHVHAIVSGGGLSLDGHRIQRPRSESYLFPVIAMGRVFAGKMKAALSRAHEAGAFARFSAFADPAGFARLLRSIRHRGWNVYAKRPFGAPTHVVSYLGRYTHRVGISNRRLLSVTSSRVVFRTKGRGVAVVTPVELLRRFVLHVLPRGFHKIRHVGLYASPDKHRRAQALLARSRRTLHRPAAIAAWRLAILTCPRCSGHLDQVPLPNARAPP